MVEIHKRFRVMGYHGLRRVDLVKFMLERCAQLWYDNVRRSRLVEATPLPWEKFEDLFI